MTAANTKEKNRDSQIPGRAQAEKSLPVLVLVLVLVLVTTLAYKSVLFNFFAGDDFVHLIWLKDAVVNHELIWRNFHSSWLDGTTTKFYRPLISVFMVSDYVLFNKDGLGFHITNLIFHLTSTVAIFFIAANLAAETMRLAKGADGAALEGAIPDASFQKLWPFCAALMFGLYPLHPEAVSWITGRVDAVVTAFITLSFWCYLAGRRSKNILIHSLCYIFLVLALLSKEMAITLPAVFILFEFFFPVRLSARGFSSRALMRRVTDALAPTAPFLLVIVVYFAVRLAALGTFVGGYDDSLFFISDLKNFIYVWISGLRLFIEPFNRELVSVRSLPVKLWDLSLVLAALLSAGNWLFFRPLTRLYIFLAGWLVMSLLPVYKVFAIADDLQGSRLAYLATVPLAMLLCLGVIGLGKRRSIMDKGFRLIHGGIFCATAFILLNLNNQAWVDGGNTANAIRQALSDLYKKVEGDPQVLFVGLPDQEHGAYICRNALPGMTRAPQLERDILNAIMVDRFEPIFPFAYVKESLFQDRDKIKIFRFDRSGRCFQPVDLGRVGPYPKTESSTPAEFSGTALKEIAEAGETRGGAVKYEWTPEGLGVEGSGGRWGRPEIKLNLPKQPCFALEFLAVSLKVSEPGIAREGLDLLYTNDLVPNYELRCRTHAHIPATALSEGSLSTQELRVVLPLRSLPEWSLGGDSHGFILKLPHGMKATLTRVEVVRPQQILPQLHFQGGGYLGSKGYLHVGKGATVDYDVSNIKDASTAMAEITRANLLFEEQNSTEPSKVRGRTIELPQVKGQIKLKADMFPALGIYQMRLWAKDSHGKCFGQASDHIVIARD